MPYSDAKTQSNMDDFVVPSYTAAEQKLLDKYNKSFMGGFPHSIDAKGRVVIPQSFRASLGNPFVIAPSQDFKAICLYSTLQWAMVRDRYERLGNNSKIKKFLVLFDAFSYRDQECDQQGRILIPIRIRKQILGDEKDIEIDGAGNCIRITKSEDFSDLLNDVLNNYEEYEAEINLADKLLTEAELRQ